MKALIPSLPKIRSRWIAILCILLAALLVQGCNRGNQTAAGGAKKGGKKGGRGAELGPVPVVVGTAIKKDVPIEITAVGNVEALSVLSVRPQVNGQLNEVFIEDGDFIKKGDKLFQIDSRAQEGQIRQAEANLLRDRAQLAQVTANLARDVANEKYAREQATRYAALFQQGVVSKDDRDRFASSADALDQLVLADKAAIQSAEAQIQADLGSIANLRLQLSFTTLYSPMDGRAGSIAVKSGNIVNASQTDLVSIAQVSPIYVAFSVPESRLAEIQRAMARAKLYVEAKPQGDLTSAERGLLTFVDNFVDSTTGTIKLKGTFQNLSRNLWPGQFVNARLRLAAQPGAIVIPGPALQAGQDGSYVYVVKEDHTVEARTVTPGIRLENEIVIAQGIAEGEIVVTEGHLRLAPGSRVTLPGEGGRGRGGADTIPGNGEGRGPPEGKKGPETTGVQKKAATGN